MFFRLLRRCARQVSDAWDAWQTVSRGDHATDRCVVVPTLGLVHLILG